MMRLALALSLSLAVAGCASYQPVPEGYAGPVATVADSGFSESGSKGQLFVLRTVDGHDIRTSFGASAEASHGRGFALTLRVIDRQVPARPMQVKLLGSHTTAAPIQALLSQAVGSFLSVEGVVDFQPEGGRRYVVKGQLAKEQSSIWIEDADTGQAVTRRITQP